MKPRLIINESNFPKVQKHGLFIVRSKPSQVKLQQSSTINRQTRSQTCCEDLEKSIDECLNYLQLQIIQEQVIQKAACIKIKQHLLALKLKYKYEKEVVVPQILMRKQSSKVFNKQKLETMDNHKNKENFTFDEFSQGQISNERLGKQENQIEIQALQIKLRNISSKMEQYQNEYQSLEFKIKQLQADLEKEQREKKQLKVSCKIEIQSKLREVTDQFQEKYCLAEKRIKDNLSYLKLRENEIISLWQLLQK